MNRCIVSVGIGERYQPYLDRLGASLWQKGAFSEDLWFWRKEWPTGSPSHQAMHYAFKYHAVRNAEGSGYNTVLWLDSACYAVSGMQPIWDHIEQEGIYLIHGETGDILGEWISDPALDYFGVTRDKAMDMPLCGGAIVGLDLENAKARKFLEWWGELAASGLFMSAHSKYAPERMTSLIVSDQDESVVLSQDVRCKGHRSDEACFSLMARALEIKTVPVSEWNRCMHSGYDL